MIYLLSRIWIYSTTETSDAAYIIGGGDAPYKLIAEFKNGEWRRFGELNQGRWAHGSITLGALTMVVGGRTSENK